MPIPGSDNEFPKVLLTELGSDPTPPDTGLVKLYALGDGLVYAIDDAGAITPLGTSLAPDAEDIPYDNGTSGLTATDVQAAIDELEGLVAGGGIPETLVNAKGDLIAADAADSVDRLPVGTNGQVLTADSGEALGVKWATPAAGNGPTAVVHKSSDQTSTSDTLADVTGMGFAVAANKDYFFEYDILFQATATTTGILFAINGPASPTDLAYELFTPQTQSSVITRYERGYDAGTQTASIDTANDSTYARIRGIFRNGSNAGTLILRFRCEGPSQTVSVRTGSCGRITLLN